jgi:hypothetical protein
MRLNNIRRCSLSAPLSFGGRAGADWKSVDHTIAAGNHIVESVGGAMAAMGVIVASGSPTAVLEICVRGCCARASQSIRRHRGRPRLTSVSFRRFGVMLKAGEVVESAVLAHGPSGELCGREFRRAARSYRAAAALTQIPFPSDTGEPELTVRYHAAFSLRPGANRP